MADNTIAKFTLRGLAKALFQFFGLTADQAIGFDENGQIKNVTGLGFTAENVANKDTDGTLAANSDTKYASQKAVKTYVDAHAGGGGSVSKATVTLTAAQIKALKATPIQIIAAPGANKFIAVHSSVAELKFVAHQYAHGPTDSNIDIIYGTDLTTLFSVLQNVSFMSSGESMVVAGALLPPANTGTSSDNVPRTLVENKAIKMAGTGTSEMIGGAIATSSLNAGGAGYAVNDTGTVSSGGPTDDATYIIDSVDGMGAVLTYHLTDNGSDYNVGTGAATATDGGQPGAGTGFTIDIASVTPGDGTLRVTLYYTIEDLQ